LNWRLEDGASPEPHPLNLIILSANHRTGSTLLQRICNARKGTLIWGEQGSLLTHFVNIYNSVVRTSLFGRQEREDYFSQGENPNLWIANMCPEIEYAQSGLIRSIRTFYGAFFAAYRNTHDILGFKEVQYGREELELLCVCYPKAQFLLLIRNPLDTWRSTPREWYPSLDYWIDKWIEKVQCFMEFNQKRSNCHLLRYEDLLLKKRTTISILHKVAKISHEQFSSVLKHKTGSSRKEISESDREAILERCCDTMKAVGYDPYLKDQAEDPAATQTEDRFARAIAA
jgi:hypothetical protein